MTEDDTMTAEELLEVEVIRRALAEGVRTGDFSDLPNLLNQEELETLVEALEAKIANEDEVTDEEEALRDEVFERALEQAQRTGNPHIYLGLFTTEEIRDEIASREAAGEDAA